MLHEMFGAFQHCTNNNTAFSWFCDVALKLSVRSELNLNLIQITHTQCFVRFNSFCEQCTQTGKHYSLMFNPGSHSIYDLTIILHQYVMITYNTYIVIRETGQFSSK